MFTKKSFSYQTSSHSPILIMTFWLTFSLIWYSFWQSSHNMSNCGKKYKIWKPSRGKVTKFLMTIIYIFFVSRLTLDYFFSVSYLKWQTGKLKWLSCIPLLCVLLFKEAIFFLSIIFMLRIHLCHSIVI